MASRPTSIYDRKYYQKLQIILILTVVVSLIVISLLVFISGQLYDAQEITDLAKITITRADGTVEVPQTNRFETVKKGDVVTVDLPLPSEKYIAGGALCFKIYNGITKISYNDKVLDEYGADLHAKKRQTGLALFTVAIPDEAWGNEIRIEYFSCENGTFNRFPVITLYPAQLISIAPPGEVVSLALIHITILVCAAILFLFYFIRFIFGMQVKEFVRGLSFAIFITLVEVWFLSQSGVLYLLLRNRVACASIEYVALYLVGIPFCLFMAQVMKGTKLRYSFIALIYLQVVFFVVLVILNYSSKIDVQYCDVLYLYVVLYIFILIYTTVCLIFITRLNAFKKNRSLRAFLIGMIVVGDLFIFELASFSFLDHKTAYMVTNFIMTLSISIVLYTFALVYLVIESENAVVQHEHLFMKQLAYTDSLTGILSRAALYEELKRIDDTKNGDYAIIFFDADNLKLINDKYGHRLGDEYLKFVAKAIEASVGESGFCGRWGGDEFIACFEAKNGFRIAKTVEQEFRSILASENKKQTFPVEISVSLGTVVSKAAAPLPTILAIEQADKAMYLAKVRAKEFRAKQQQNSHA